ncbi:hypothetical protein QQO25_09690 [Corynebacterium lehmanniae]|nr:hypothetical protein [Corynebacterium lehmanniae]
MSVRVPSRSLAALTAVALVSSISQVLAPAAEAAPVATVDQGDLIYNETTGQECAVGWLHDGYAFTAGQCGADGETFSDIDGNVLGSFETLYDPETRRNDFGWIKLDMDVAEGVNEYEELAGDLPAGDWVSTNGATPLYRYIGFDGATGVAANKLGEMAVLGQAVVTDTGEVAGIYTGWQDSYSLVTRLDRIAESPYPVDPAHIVRRDADDHSQHAEVFTFAPDTGKAEQIHYPPVPVLNQGERIGTPESDSMLSRCTIGWINEGVLYTSGHCGEPGAEMYTVKYWGIDPDTGKEILSLGTKVGTFGTNEGGLKKLRNDAGWIEMDTPWVRAGENVRSGDTIIPFEEITNGLEVCAWGMTTKRVRCGKVLGTDGAEILMDDGVDGEPGDSGGPVWAKDGSGFVGLYSGSTGERDNAQRYATASRPDFETDNKDSIDLLGILRAIQMGVPYYQLLPIFRALLGERGEEFPTAMETFNQGDPLYDYNGNITCRVGYVQGERLFVSSDCGYNTLYSALGRPVGTMEHAQAGDGSVATLRVTGARMVAGTNAQGFSTIAEWDEMQPGDELCAAANGTGDPECTTLAGVDGVWLITVTEFSDRILPGTPMWIPGKGFVGVHSFVLDGHSVGTRIDFAPTPDANDPVFAAPNFELVVKAHDLKQPYFQRTNIYRFDPEAPDNRPEVALPHRVLKAGDPLFDENGNEVCELGWSAASIGYTSSDCTSPVFTSIGERIGRTNPASYGDNQVATLESYDAWINIDDSTTAVAPWADLTPGDEVCAGDACTEFAGYDGSKLVLVDDLPGVLPGAGLHVKGKGLAGVYHRDGIGSRTDMIDDGWTSPNTEQIRKAYRKGERFFAHNDANFWSRASGAGAAVPFPTRKLDEGTMLYDASGAPTCIIGRVEDEHLYVSADCQSDGFFTAAGEYVGDLEVPAAATERTSPGIIAVTGRRMEPGANTHLEHAAWDELQPGDELCSDAGCGTFFGLDGAQIIHDAPVPAQPGAALWNPQKGFVGVSGAGGAATRIDMLTSEAPTDSATAVKRAHELGVRFYQRASANFWSPNHYGGEVPFERHPRINQGDLLYDASGDPRCSISLIQDDVLFTSPDCAAFGDTLYSEFGEPLGQLTVPAADTTTRNKFAYVELDTPFVQPGSNGVTGDDVVEWSDANPGDEVCVSTASGERCGTYLGQDGSAVVLSDGLTDSADHADPRTIGAPVWIPGKGFLAVYAGEVDGFHTGARIDMITRGNPATNFRAVADAHDRNETYYQQVPANFFNVENLDGMTVPFPKKPAPKPTPKPTPVPTEAPSPSPASTTSPAPSSEQPVPATLTTTVPSTTSVAEPTAATPRTETASTTRMTPAKSNVAPAEDSHVSEPEAGNGNDGSANGSSTGGIIAAILIPLVLVGLGFLATQVVDTTQFGLPPVPQILPLKR